jgi:hypothetical protein
MDFSRNEDWMQQQDTPSLRVKNEIAEALEDYET